MEKTIPVLEPLIEEEESNNDGGALSPEFVQSTDEYKKKEESLSLWGSNLEGVRTTSTPIISVTVPACRTPLIAVNSFNSSEFKTPITSSTPEVDKLPPYDNNKLHFKDYTPTNSCLKRSKYDSKTDDLFDTAVIDSRKRKVTFSDSPRYEIYSTALETMYTTEEPEQPKAPEKPIGFLTAMANAVRNAFQLLPGI
jgi:hypothetical protein